MENSLSAQGRLRRRQVGVEVPDLPEKLVSRSVVSISTPAVSAIHEEAGQEIDRIPDSSS